MKQSAIVLAQNVVQACKAKNIRHIVLSPGSRNAPLTISFSNDPFFECYSIVDERCAAFFALGIAQQIGYPVAVVCTSGSALLNYYPAVAEAFYSNIPLVVISADRPSHKIDIGDGQTIRQVNVLANHSAYNANLSDENFSQKSNTYELNQALNTAILQQAPVHINVPLEEPLYTTTEEVYPFENQSVTKPKEYIDPQAQKDFVHHWNKTSKKMILVGVLPPNSLISKYIDFLANDPSVLVLTETTSNLHHPNFIASIDSLLTFAQKDDFLKNELRPELLLTFGGLVVSKKIKQFLRKFQPDFHYHIDLFKGYDSYFCLTHHFKSSINFFFEETIQHLENRSSQYQAKWLKINKLLSEKHQEYLQKIPYSDMKVYEQIFSYIPDNELVTLSNSSTVRYAQLFENNPSWKVFCNRGTSGIDGSTSTAIGAAVGSQCPTLLITGDLSFFYDSNALWNSYIPKDFKIILVNNGGGGIFRILPGDKTDKHFETYFETPHTLTAEHLCKMYRFEYSQITDNQALTDKIKMFFEEKTNRPKLLEILTPRKENDSVLLNYFNFLSDK